jgi:fucose 4-O-acetylase-like acetyltransferase
MPLPSTPVQTSPDRDRYADFLRVLSISLVVLGHWLAAVVLVRDGELVTGRLHALVPWTQWLTWVFQVMPVFFIVGGFVNARSWSRAARDKQSWSAWTRRRCQRLLVPLFPLVAFWVLLTPVRPIGCRIATRGSSTGERADLGEYSTRASPPIYPPP